MNKKNTRIKQKFHTSPPILKKGEPEQAIINNRIDQLRDCLYLIWNKEQFEKQRNDFPDQKEDEIELAYYELEISLHDAKKWLDAGEWILLANEMYYIGEKIGRLNNSTFIKAGIDKLQHPYKMKAASMAKLNKIKEVAIEIATERWKDGDDLRPGEMASAIENPLLIQADELRIDYPTTDTIRGWISDSCPENLRGKPGRRKKN